MNEAPDVIMLEMMRQSLRSAVVCDALDSLDSKERQLVTAIDVPVEIDGVRFRPGDLVIADADGVVVIPQAIEKDAIQRAWEKTRLENRSREAIKKGTRALEAYRTFGVL